jgi:hypothetical protein
MNWSTALSSIGNVIGGAARAVTPAVQALLPTFAPLAVSALTPQPRTGHYSGGGGGGMAYSRAGMSLMPGYSGIALPGGATVQHPGMVQRGFETLFGGSNPYGPGMALQAPTAPGARMPHLMQVPHARGDGSVVTYVRAPAVAYSVSIRRKGGRCRKGR